MKYSHILHLDIETYSPENLADSGVYRYSESENFEVLLFACSLDGGEVRVWDLAQGDRIPERILRMLSDPEVQKVAHNASFERVCLSRFLGLPPGTYLSPEGWFCSMVACAELGLPHSLEGAGAVLGLEKQKLTEGKDLVRLFCTPHKASDGGMRRVLPGEEPEKWSRFVSYNKRDVETEMEIWNRLSRFPVPESEWQLYRLDQRINDRGIQIDSVLVGQAIRCERERKELSLQRAKELTGLPNPASPAQLKDWLSRQGVSAPSLTKQTVEDLAAQTEGEVHEMLLLRQELSRSSVSKYRAMEDCVCRDGRVRGLLQFYGTHTGRWSGRLVQVQNLPQNHLENLDDARALLRAGEFFKLAHSSESASVSGVLSELIRTAFVPKEGCRFFVADFSAVEARCLSYLAGEKWRQEVFAKNEDIYCKSAEAMFHVPVEKNGVNAHLRAKGKIAELALGFGGSVSALEQMGALKLGLRREELKPLVDAWRGANRNIVSFWWAVDRALKHSVRERTKTTVGEFAFLSEPGVLFACLPSGRKLSYLRPRIVEGKYGSPVFSYEGRTAQKSRERMEMTGPKMVENLVQAYARDLLAEAMLRLSEKGYEITMSVHDEVVIEAPRETDLQEICDRMAQSPAWAEGLLLRADGFVCDTYRK